MLKSPFENYTLEIDRVSETQVQLLMLNKASTSYRAVVDLAGLRKQSRIFGIYEDIGQCVRDLERACAS